jgi:hypothetical protein
MGTREELLRYLWDDLINLNLRPESLDNVIRHCRRHPDGPFGDTGLAIERILGAGASVSDLCLVLRATAYEAVFGTLYALGDPGVDDNDVFMLHESLLTAEPSGMDGSPGAAAKSAYEKGWSRRATKLEY